MQVIQVWDGDVNDEGDDEKDEADNAKDGIDYCRYGCILKLKIFYCQYV